jgi:tRNA G18 (ribose-2'-O)-methylase SpoU
MITDIDNLAVPELAAYASLTETQLRNRLDPEMGIFIAESPNVIKAALKAGCEPLSLLTERRHLEGTAKEVIELLGDGIPIFTGDRDTLAQLTGYELTRGVLCAMRRPQPKTTSEVCSGKRRIAVIDSVVNATNTGAIFRAAAALGIEAVLLSPSCSDPLNRRCVRVSMGTVFQVPWAYLDDVKQLRQMGFTSVAMALRDDALPIDDLRLKAPERIAIVLGNEGDGLSQQTIDSCDLVAMIPMQNGVDSLNVAAAAAVAFWEMRIR